MTDTSEREVKRHIAKLEVRARNDDMGVYEYEELVLIMVFWQGKDASCGNRMMSCPSKLVQERENLSPGRVAVVRKSSRMASPHCRSIGGETSQGRRFVSGLSLFCARDDVQVGIRGRALGLNARAPGPRVMIFVSRSICRGEHRVGARACSIGSIVDVEVGADVVDIVHKRMSERQPSLNGSKDKTRGCLNCAPKRGYVD